MEQIIQLPDNLEVKEIKDNKIILVEKKKDLTYEDVARKLFYDNPCVFYSNSAGKILQYHCISYDNSNNCLSRKQGEKLIAFNKLMNIAKYLNDGWQPDWSNANKPKYYVSIVESEIKIRNVFSQQSGGIYFRSSELAKQAIEILGEETIKLALCTDY